MHPLFAMLDAPIVIAIGVIVLVLFGAERLPKLARAMGEAKKEFDTGVHRPTPSAAPESQTDMGVRAQIPTPPAPPVGSVPPQQSAPPQPPYQAP